MPPAADEDEKQLRGLFDRLSAVQGGLHTIQVLSVDPNTDNEFRWLLLSKHIDTYELAVQNFTLYHRAQGKSARTLAFDDHCQWDGFYHPWEAKRGDMTPPPGELQFKPREFGAITRVEADEPLGLRVSKWHNSLEFAFPGGGSTIWLTIRHRLKGTDEPPVSSIYLVFDELINDDEKKKDVIHGAREYLFDQVLRFYERQIEKQHEKIEESIREFLLKDRDDFLISDETRLQISSMKPLLAGRIPLVVEGERGTGKLSVARRVQETRGQIPPCGHRSCTDVDSAEPLQINCMFLSGEYSETLKCLQSKGILTASGDIADDIGRDIIFDDIHVASSYAQHVIYRLVESRFAWNAPAGSHSRPPWIILTVSPSLEAAIQQGQVIPELGLLSPFKVSLPTLHDRLGRMPDEHRLERFRDIVSHLGKRAQEVMPNAPPFEIAEPELELWMGLPWRDNYWGLRQKVLQHVITSLR